MDIISSSEVTELNQTPTTDYFSGIKKLFRGPEIRPINRENGLRGFHYKGKEFIHHSSLHHSESAFYSLATGQKIFLFLISILLILCFALNWHDTLVLFVSVITFLYFSDLLFNLFLIYRSFSKSPAIKVTDEEIAAAHPSDWKGYTIFCPLYKEWEVIPQFVTAMSRLDYPQDKLQIILLLEEDDKESLENVKKFSLPKNVEVIVVPHSMPKTKPKALNYGLQFAKGEYVVIYDAEDIPDARQLKKVILAFKKADPKTICVQAKLNFYNPHQNILTRVFTAEYALWFDLVLTGLQSIHAPLPLGGTSNHFRRTDLHKLRGWDSFNVTEDCDLGIRLVKSGYLTAVVDSTTLEEANSSLGNWMNQRTRWIKGYMQTYLVHTRNMFAFMKSPHKSHLVTFHLIVGGKILSMLINPLMWIITISYFAFRPIVGPTIESFYPTPVLYMGLFSLVIGNFLYMYYYMIGCAKREYDDIIKYVILVPFYWLLMSVAAFRAAVQVVTNPHYWFKTKHGLHLRNKKASEQATMNVGNKLVDSAVVQTA